MNIIEKTKTFVKEHKKVVTEVGMAVVVGAAGGVGYLLGARDTNSKWSTICNMAAFGDEVVKLTYGPTGDKFNMVLTKVVDTVEDVVEI